MVSKDKNLDVVGFLEPFYHRQWWVENRELCGNLEEVVTFHQLHQIFKGLIKYTLAKKGRKSFQDLYSSSFTEREGMKITSKSFLSSLAKAMALTALSRASPKRAWNPRKASNSDFLRNFVSLKLQRYLISVTIDIMQFWQYGNEIHTKSAKWRMP